MESVLVIREVFISGGIVLPLIEVTREEFNSGWVVLLLKEVFGLLVNGLESEGIFNDENLSDLEEASAAILYFGVGIMEFSIILALIEVSGKLNFLGVEAKWGLMTELTFGIKNDGILMDSLLISEFWENFSRLEFDEKVSKFVLS